MSGNYFRRLDSFLTDYVDDFSQRFVDCFWYGNNRRIKFDIPITLALFRGDTSTLKGGLNERMFQGRKGLPAIFF